MSIVQTLIGSIVTSGNGGSGPPPPPPPPDTYPVPGSGAYISNTGSAGQTLGTAYDPGGAVSTVSNMTSGWYYTIKDGQFQSQFGSTEDLAFFQGTTPIGVDVFGGFGFQNLNIDNYAIQWVGYVQVSVTGDYNISLTADDLLYFWIGTTALEGNYTFANRHHLVNNTQSYNVNSVTLTAGQYYPIRMWFQEWTGAERAQVLLGRATSNALAMNQVVIVVDSINGHTPLPTYTITPAADNVDEGSSLEFVIGGTNIPDGTYYWTVAGDGPFGVGNGSFTITDNAGSITVTPQANQNTDGAKAFTLSIRSFDIFGTVLATSESVTINDTSLTPEAPFSLQFVQSQTDYLDVAASSDWALGTTWTIEYWNQAAMASTEGTLYTVMCQNFDVAGGIDLLYIGQQLQLNGARLVAEPNPGRGVISIADWAGNSLGGWDTPLYTNLATSGGSGTGLTVDVVAGGGYIDINSITINNPGRGYAVNDVITINNQENYPGTFTITAVAGPVWTHVALVSDGTDLTVYYDGVGVYTGGAVGLSNITDAIRVGARGPATFQGFDGRLALIRISDTAKYTTAFTATTTYGVEADTVLFLDSDTPLTDASASAHIITNNGVSLSTDFPT